MGYRKIESLINYHKKGFAKLKNTAPETKLSYYKTLALCMYRYLLCRDAKAENFYQLCIKREIEPATIDFAKTIKPDASTDLLIRLVRKVSKKLTIEEKNSKFRALISKESK